MAIMATSSTSERDEPLIKQILPVEFDGKVWNAELQVDRCDKDVTSGKIIVNGASLDFNWQTNQFDLPYVTNRHNSKHGLDTARRFARASVHAYARLIVAHNAGNSEKHLSPADTNPQESTLSVSSHIRRPHTAAGSKNVFLRRAAIINPELLSPADLARAQAQVLFINRSVDEFKELGIELGSFSDWLRTKETSSTHPTPPVGKEGRSSLSNHGDSKGGPAVKAPPILAATATRTSAVIRAIDEVSAAQKTGVGRS